MSQEYTAPTHQPDASDATQDASQESFKPSADMNKRNRRFGYVFLGIIAFLVVLTVVTRVMLSS